MKYKVSVIIPVYNVERYIERCARSLFEQTLKEIEFIFVDDCTPDSSIKVVEKLMQYYPNRENDVRIIRHEKNKGLPAARRTGIEYATGEYIAHCDSDDWVDVNMYGCLYEAAIKYKADIVACDDVEFFSESKQLIYRMFDDEKPTYKDNSVSTWLSKWSLVCKLIKRDIYYKPYVTVNNNNGEDMALFCQLLYYSDQILYVPKPFYFADKTGDSISRVDTSEKEVKKILELCEGIKTIELFYKQYADYRKEKRGIYSLKLSVKLSLPLIFQHKMLKSMWNQVFPELNFIIGRISNLSIRDNVRYMYYYFKKIMIV